MSEIDTMLVIPDDAMTELVEVAPGLTDLERKYIYWRALGNPPKLAMTRAGYKSNGNASQLDSRPKIREALSALQEQLEPEFRVTRKRVMGMLGEAAEMARMKGQAANLIAAAVEMARIAGVDAPQRIQIDQRSMQVTDQGSGLKSLKDMSKEELERRAGIRRRLGPPPIEGEYAVVEESEP